MNNNSEMHLNMYSTLRPLHYCLKIFGLICYNIDTSNKEQPFQINIYKTIINVILRLAIIITLFYFIIVKNDKTNEGVYEVSSDYILLIIGLILSIIIMNYYQNIHTQIIQLIIEFDKNIYEINKTLKRNLTENNLCIILIIGTFVTIFLLYTVEVYFSTLGVIQDNILFILLHCMAAVTNSIMLCDFNILVYIVRVRFQYINTMISQYVENITHNFSYYLNYNDFLLFNQISNLNQNDKLSIFNPKHKIQQKNYKKTNNNSGKFFISLR